MDTIKTNCPRCGTALELPRDFDNVICASCGTAYHIRQYKGAINLSAVEQKMDRATSPLAEPNGSGGIGSIEMRLAELDEEIANVGSEIEQIKSKEQAAPLQMGCALFGVFGLAILVIAFFMTVARSLFGKWPFYLSLAVIILLGVIRMRRRLTSPDQLDWLREQRMILEDGLAELEAERGRLEQLKTSITSNDKDSPAKEKGS